MGNVCCAESRPSDGHYEKALEKVKDKGPKAQFEDADFPAGKGSLIPDWNDPGDDTTSIKDAWEKFVWLRPDKIKGMEAPILLFDKGIEPGDIKQGQLGDCYFLSSLSVIAEEGNRIKLLFHNKEANP